MSSESKSKLEQAITLMREARKLGIEIVRVGDIEVKAYPMQQIIVPDNQTELPKELGETRLDEMDEDLLYMSSD